MKKWTEWLLGSFRLTISGGSPQWCLNRLTKKGVPFSRICWLDEFTVCISIPRPVFRAAEAAVDETMCRIESVREMGAPQRYRGLRKRYCLLAFLALTTVSCLIVPQFVWFFRVEGNDQVPAAKIIRQVQAAGVQVGTYGKRIQSSQVENAVLSQIPGLAFLTINQSGGCAEIIVREKTPSGEVVDRRSPRNMVAKKTGLITRVSVLDGKAEVQPGDTVQQGQMLINGFVDLEYKYRVCGADGEVYARTWNEETVVTPAIYDVKSWETKEKQVFYLCFGQKRIKITPGSRIYPDECGKMTKTMQLTLPGGYSLPVALVKETYRFFSKQEVTRPALETEEFLKQTVLERAERDMVAGAVRQLSCSFGRQGEIYRMQAAIEAEEMIAHPAAAEIFKGD